MANLKLISLIISGITASTGVGLPAYSFYQEYSGDQFLLKEQYKEAKESYEKANNFYIPKYISKNYQNDNLNIKIKKSNDLEESKTNYTRALELFVGGNKNEAKELFSKVISEDKNYLEALNKISEINSDTNFATEKETQNSTLQNDVLKIPHTIEGINESKEIEEDSRDICEKELKNKKDNFNKEIQELEKEIKIIQDRTRDFYNKCYSPDLESCDIPNIEEEKKFLNIKSSELNGKISRTRAKKAQLTCEFSF